MIKSLKALLASN